LTNLLATGTISANYFQGKFNSWKAENQRLGLQCMVQGRLRGGGSPVRTGR